MKVKLSDLANMSSKEREVTLDALVHAALQPPTKQDIARLEKKVQAFEQRNEMSSNDMLRQLQNGQIKETNEVCSWLMAISLLEETAANVTSARRQPLRK